MARGEYLLEVRSEEIPARMLAAGVHELATRVFEELMARGLRASEIETGFTPRRLLVRLSGLQEREPDREEQVMGPPVRAAYAGDGSPTPALLGFARRCGVEPEQLLRVATEKGEYLAAARRTAGRPTATVLSELVPRILAAISWPKTMRWGAGEGPWVRPVHGLVSLLDGEVVPFELFGVAAGFLALDGRHDECRAIRPHGKRHQAFERLRVEPGEVRDRNRLRDVRRIQVVPAHPGAQILQWRGRCGATQCLRCARCMSRLGS